MPEIVGTIKSIYSDEAKQNLIFPRTKVEAVSDANGNSLSSLINAKQDTLVSGTNIKTINNASLLGSGDITVGGDTNVIETVKVNNTALPVSNKAVNIDLSGYATTSALSNKQDTLVSGTNIKTVNSTSLLGSGDISINSDYYSATNTQATIDTANKNYKLNEVDITSPGLYMVNASFYANIGYATIGTMQIIDNLDYNYATDVRSFGSQPNNRQVFRINKLINITDSSINKLNLHVFFDTVSSSFTTSIDRRISFFECVCLKKY